LPAKKYNDGGSTGGKLTGSRNHIETLLFGLFNDGDFLYVGNADKGMSKGKQAEDLRGEPANLRCKVHLSRTSLMAGFTGNQTLTPPDSSTAWNAQA
jgi:hypothetical protein